jgi:hypothetical protein
MTMNVKDLHPRMLTRRNASQARSSLFVPSVDNENKTVASELFNGARNSF